MGSLPNLDQFGTSQFLTDSFQRGLAHWNRERLQPGLPEADWQKLMERDLRMARLEGGFRTAPLETATTVRTKLPRLKEILDARSTFLRGSVLEASQSLQLTLARLCRSVERGRLVRRSWSAIHRSDSAILRLSSASFARVEPAAFALISSVTNLAVSSAFTA